MIGVAFETAYSLNHFSNRGLLSWTLEPLPDGRIQEIGKLAEIAQRLEPMLLGSRAPSPNDVAPCQLEGADDQAALRVRNATDRGKSIAYVILINRNLKAETQVTCAFVATFHATEIARRGTTLLVGPDRGLSVSLPPGAGACYRLQRVR